MSLPPAVSHLVSARRLEAVPADLSSAVTRLERAAEKLKAAKSIVEIDIEVAYVTVYDATRIAVTAHCWPTATGRVRSHEHTKPSATTPEP